MGGSTLGYLGGAGLNKVNKPRVDQFDPNVPSQRGAQATQADFLNNFIKNPSYGNAYTQSGLGQLAGQQMAGQIAVNDSPEQQVFRALQPFLMNMAGGQGGQNPFSELQFGNQFTELADPFGGAALGGLNAGQRVVEAGLPSQVIAMQEGINRTNMAAPGRFSSALAQQGRDVTTQSLNDYNMFVQQALMQGLGLDVQDRGQVRDFTQGARGLQQQAAQNTAQNQLGARGLQQEAALGFGQLGAQNQLGAMGLLGQLAAQSANNPFQRMLQAGQFGQEQLNPALQILLGGMGYLKPQGMDTVVGKSPLDYMMDLFKAGAAASGAKGG